MLHWEIEHTYKDVKKAVLLGMIFTVVLSVPFHFLYRWIGGIPAAAVFLPVNESVWEHLKLTFYPMALWWLVVCPILLGRKKVEFPRLFISFAAAALTAPAIIVALFYTLQGAFGVESLASDILILVAAVIVSHLLALDVYRCERLSKGFLLFSAFAVLLLFSAFAMFTFFPPRLPLFLDTPTGKYGIL